jgi:hypothetical protein
VTRVLENPDPDRRREEADEASLTVLAWVRRSLIPHSAWRDSGRRGSVFDRYDIVSGNDLKDAARKLDAVGL